MTKHYEDSLFKVTDNGSFGVEVMLPSGDLEMGVNSLDLIIHDSSDADVTGARIVVEPWMPEMGHGVSTAPAISERGGGMYEVRDVMFSMTGEWELRITVTSGDVTDKVAIELPEVGAMGHTHAMKAPDMAKMDLADKRMSKNGLFHVSYTLDTAPAPVNQFLSLTLQVKTPDGRPVDGARISIAGDMPEHGHGFPTVPEVTEELGDGKYLVEGIKFSMPGWWVLSFHLSAGGKMDSASFNLVLQ
ncbi:MAG: FixH family protein [bacterium]|nr:MAG: FixH family protein [bacterium]